jgi:hypothetical protein
MTRVRLASPYLPAQSVHQPLGLIGPSTSLHEDGGINSLQLSHLWLPLGWLWYPTDAFDAFAASAEFAVANMIGAAEAAAVIPCKTERLETTIDQILGLSAMLAVPFEESVILEKARRAPKRFASHFARLLARYCLRCCDLAVVEARRRVSTRGLQKGC